MNADFKLGSIWGLEITARRSAPAAFLGLWLALALAAGLVLQMPFITAFFGAMGAAALHWAAALLHHLGHARAAKRSGHPMIGIRFWGLLAISLYPPDEPKLPASVHIQRALGGPTFSLVVALLAGLFLFAFPWLDQIWWWWLLFLFLDSSLVFTVGALIPLSFTDGGTLLTWLRKR